jgi:uncharacterized BrkB/YihY/UPF0761 family membrane protein
LPENRANQPYCPHPARAYFKIAAVATALGITLGALITFVSRDSVNDLQHHLTLWLVVAIVAIINIGSFLLFAVFWLIYRWIRRDLSPDEDG